MNIKRNSRLHGVLSGINRSNGRYHECWTEKSVEKLVAGGYINLEDAPAGWGWGKAKTCVVTALGFEALAALETSKMFVPKR